MTPFESTVPLGSAPSVIPVLRVVIPDAEIPQAVRAALDQRELARAQFMALADELIQELRPELERFATEWVQRGLRRAWAQQSKPDLG
jgi:hypothetical protein